MNKTISIIIIYLFITLSLNAAELYPTALLKTDSFFTHHVLIAEKSTHKLYLYENAAGLPKLVRTFQMATGKKAGNKLLQGDYRTPEGVYVFSQFLTHQDLLNRHGDKGKIYGVGAFVMNYPNPMDLRSSKTGSGIWLHSTNDETRIEKGLDSRGCIVAANKHLIDIARYIELNRTAIVVVHEMQYSSEEVWNAKRNKLIMTVNSWVDSWSNEDLSSYISFYHPQQFFDRNKGYYADLKKYKRAVFSGAGKPQIKISNMSVLLSGNDYAVVTFTQDYQAKSITDIGKKTLYLRRDQFYEWKIVSENWTKAGIQINTDDQHASTRSFAFEPSMRFFKSKKIEDYLEVKGQN